MSNTEFRRKKCEALTPTVRCTHQSFFSFFLLTSLFEILRFARSGRQLILIGGPPALRSLRSLFIVVFLTCVSYAEDAVIIHAASDRPQVRRTGTIVDYKGAGVTLELVGGRREQISLDQVVAIETAKVKEQENADRFFAEGKYRDALVEYRLAVEADNRAWMRRQILAQMVVCYHRLNRIAEAGDTFSIIVRSDPTTQHFAVIPLSWAPRQSPALEERAKIWMAQEDLPAMALLGASWLLTTAERGSAEDTLRTLATGKDASVAMLAEAQRWRTQIVTATPQDASNWQRRIEQFPKMLRAGPYLTLGRALARLEQHERAALTLMRIPILHPIQYDLAAEALMLAGEELKQAGNKQEALSVFRELVNDYPDHRLASAAQQQLDEQ
jgi:tetratricopeptide (TPR) repeat protein